MQRTAQRTAQTDWASPLRPQRERSAACSAAGACCATQPPSRQRQQQRGGGEGWHLRRVVPSGSAKMPQPRAASHSFWPSVTAAAAALAAAAARPAAAAARQLRRFRPSPAAACLPPWIQAAQALGTACRRQRSCLERRLASTSGRAPDCGCGLPLAAALTPRLQPASRSHSRQGPCRLRRSSAAGKGPPGMRSQGLRRARLARRAQRFC